MLLTALHTVPACVLTCDLWQVDRVGRQSTLRERILQFLHTHRKRQIS